MKIIFKIAMAELRSLFYSPVAWVVGITFFVISGLKFIIMIFGMAMWQEGLQDVSSVWTGFDMSLSDLSFNNLFETVSNYLYLFIPLLTMGVINRELNAGTIKLLYSSPVKPAEIVLGKFLGLAGFVLLMLLLLIVLMSAGLIAIEHLEFNVLPSALLGYLLLGCAYASIGLFISSLTSYQIVAGVLTFVVFFLLHMMGGVWQQYDFVRDITWFLSINGRVENFTAGLITSRDIIYFLLIIAMFIGFSIIKLRSIHEPVGWKTNMGRYLSVAVVVLLLGYLSSRPSYILYADVTKDQDNTIHPVTRQVLEELGDEKLTVTLYTNLFDPSCGHGLPQNRNRYIWKFWEKYIRFHPDIDFRYVYYYDVKDSDTAYFHERYGGRSIDEVAEELFVANGLPGSLFKTPQEIRKQIDLSGEDMRLVMQLEYRGKKAWLRTYPNGQDPWPWEMHMSAAISRLVNDHMPLLCFTTGNYERSPFKRGEKEFYNSTANKLNEVSLLNEGVDADTINLLEKNIPDSISVLVVADPKSAFSETKKQKILAYLAAGGNAIFYGEPGKQEMLNPLLNTIGVNLENGTLVRPGMQEMPHILHPQIIDSGAYMAGEPLLYQYQHKRNKPQYLKIPGTAVLSYQETDGFKIDPIFNLRGDDTTWIEKGKLVVDSAAPVYAPAEGDLQQSSYVTGIRLSRFINNKEQRIVVTGDADFMSDLRGAGAAFGNAAYSWLLNNQYPKYVNRPLPADTKFLIGEEGGRALYIVYLIVIPVVFIIMGIVILIRRNRK